MKHDFELPMLTLKKKVLFLFIVGLLAFSMGLFVAKNASAVELARDPAQLTSEKPNDDSATEGTASVGSSTLRTKTIESTTETTTRVSNPRAGTRVKRGAPVRGGNVSQPNPAVTQPKIIYPKNSRVDFEGLTLQGEVRNPGEFYFQRRPEEKFDSLVKRRKNFHKEMLRDVVISK